MNCDLCVNLYLMSNGSLTCGINQNRDFIPYNKNINYYNDVLNGDKFKKAKENMKNNFMPLGDDCINCDVLYEAYPSPNNNDKVKSIDTFIVEPTVNCNVVCSNCGTNELRKSLRTKFSHAHHILSYEIFEKVLKDIAGKVNIRMFEFCGWGEPTLNKDIGKMSRLAKELFPSSYIQLVTNTQGRLKSNEHCFDSIIHSIDGIEQEEFARYRTEAKYNKAISFVESQVDTINVAGGKIYNTWKYILFNHNDSENNLIQLYKKSLELKVDELRITFTQYGPVSKKFFELGQLLRKIASDRTLCATNDTISFERAYSYALENNIEFPFPKEYFDAPKGFISFWVVMSSNNNLDESINIIKGHLSNQNNMEALRFLSRAINKIWMIYKDIGFEYISMDDKKRIHELFLLSKKFKDKELELFHFNKYYSDLVY